MNDIYILYKQTESTKEKVTEFKNKLTASGAENVKTLKDFVIKDYNCDLTAEESYFEGNMSLVLLCFIDDEFFYEANCRRIWSAFWGRQRSLGAQIIFPVRIEEVVADNFDGDKKDIFEMAKMLGLYSIKDEDEDKDDLCSDIKEALEKIDKSTNKAPELSDDTITNVHPACHIENGLIVNFQKCKDEKDTLRREKILNKARGDLKTILDENYDKIITKRKYGEKKGVCVLYTGGTAGMIHGIGSMELKQASVYELVPKLPRLKREEFEIDFYSFEKPLDSSNITSGHWLVMAAVIETLKDKYQGFVIIHGANTMAYSAAALSFLLDNVDRPIILTGSELGLTELNTDAEQNIQRSVEIAAYNSCNEENVSDVCILFGRRLLRGNRSTKQIALDTTEGFYSPNYPELASVSHDRVVIDSSRLKVGRQNSIDGISTISANYSMASEPRVVICDIYPDMDMDMFQTNTLKFDVGAVIIRTYGTGGVPSENTKFTDCLKKLKENNKVVVNLTQCPRGNVELRIFETNATLFNLGVISGGDMVTEAAYCKLKHLFSKFEKINDPKDKADIIRHYMMVSMHDELTMSTFTVCFEEEAGRELIIENGTKAHHLKCGRNWSDNPAEKYNGDDKTYANDTFAVFDSTAHITNAVLRLSGVEILDEEKQELSTDNEKTVSVTHSIVVSLSNDSKSLILESSARVNTNTYKREYELDHNNQTVDINIDVLKQAKEALKRPQSELHISICSMQHKIKVKSVHLLISVAQKKKG
jgi:L-asparaginase